MLVDVSAPMKVVSSRIKVGVSISSIFQVNISCNVRVRLNIKKNLWQKIIHVKTMV